MPLSPPLAAFAVAAAVLIWVISHATGDDAVPVLDQSVADAGLVTPTISSG
jgi:hypothetical protein